MSDELASNVEGQSGRAEVICTSYAMVIVCVSRMGDEQPMSQICVL